MKGLLLIAGAAFVAYKLYENMKIDPQYTNLEGWESTAKNRRPDMPAPSVSPEPLHAVYWPKTQAGS